MEEQRQQQAARKVFQQKLLQNAMVEGNEDEVKKELEVQEQKTSEELQSERASLKIRETGWWFWRTVVIPPNAYVVHTRRGCSKPITLGLGLSFRFRPRTDSYLAVPATLQTIGIVAQGISKEKQGISILAYVQWLISDFSIAYRRLDFSDPKDPVSIVNAQLREQAEAAIKDKISTMTVEEILTDKAPIIEELTQRMKTVAEGASQGGVGGGLGLQIVTVQIKEAFVCSQRLWEFLQAPFRNEREREARLSRLRVEEEIRQQELSNHKSIESSEAQTQSDIAKFKASKERESFEIVLKERMCTQEIQSQEQQRNIELQQQIQTQQRASLRALEEQGLRNAQEIGLIKLQQEQQLALERAKLDAEKALQSKEMSVAASIKQLEVETKLKQYEYQLRLQQLEGQKVLLTKEHEVAQQELQQRLQRQATEQEYRLELEQAQFEQERSQEQETNRIQNEQKQKELEFLKAKQAIENGLSQASLTSRMIDALPDLAKQLPKIQELRTLHISSDPNSTDGFSILTTYLAKLLEMARGLGLKIPGTETIEAPQTDEKK